jgi:hypothetical protein
MTQINRDPVEEIVRIISAMTPEERSNFCKEMFRYEPSRPCDSRESYRMQNQSPER